MKSILLILVLAFCYQLNAQNEVTWKVPVSGEAKSIFFHPFTQTPIVETADAYYGIDRQNHTILWNVKKSATKKALRTVSTITSLAGSSDITQLMDLREYTEIPNTQFISVNNTLLDVATGEVVLGENKNPYKTLINWHILPQQNLLLLNVKAEDDTQKLYAIDIATNEIKWGTQLADASKMKDLAKFVTTNSNLYSIDLSQPCALQNGNIIYSNDGKLMLLNGIGGGIMWENACNPGTFFTDTDQTHIFVVERNSSLSNMVSIKGPKSFGKKVIALDINTGKTSWNSPIKLDGNFLTHQFIDNNQLLLAYEDGINLYNLQNGEKVWKKNFKASNLKDVNLVSTGIELQYGNKLTVVDPKTGKSNLKKPIEFKDIDEKSKFDFISKEYAQTRMIITEAAIMGYDLKTGKTKWTLKYPKETRIAFDDAAQKVLVLTSKSIYLIAPDQASKKIKPLTAKLNNGKEILGYETTPNGYFIYGMKEYILLDKNGEMIAQQSYPQLKEKQLERTALLTAGIVSGLMSSRVETYAGSEKTSETGIFVDIEAAKNFEAASNYQMQLRKEMKANAKQRKSVRTDATKAYFLKGTKDNNTNKIELIVVDKQTGKELKAIPFSDDRSVIYEIDQLNNQLYFVENNQFCTINL